MTGSLRLSALLLLLLSRWASADLEKGEDDYVRSWVIIEEQLVPPSRDEFLATGGGGGGGAVAGRRITPKSVFVAPSFNKCSDGYRPDSMGRCVKVVKINQAAQWDFLLKQLNSMYGPGAGGGGGFPSVPGASAMTTTTTAEPPLQKTDSPGPFQVNIPLGVAVEPAAVASVNETTAEPVGTAVVNVTTAAAVTASVAGTTVPDVVTADSDGDVTAATADDADSGDHTADVATGAAGTARPRPYRNRYQTQTRTEDAATTVVTSPYESTTAAATDTKTMYVDNSRTTTMETDDPSQTIKTTTDASPSSPVTLVTATAAEVTETEELASGTAAATTTTASATTMTNDDAGNEDVVTVLAVAMDGGRPGVPATGPSRTQTPPALVTDATTPEYYDDQPEEPTSAPEVDCSDPNAYQYYAACASFRLKQQQQLQQLQLQQLQQQQQQLHQLQQYQQQQQLYHHHQQHPQPPPPQPHVATALVKRPVTTTGTGGPGVPVRFPEEVVDPSSAAADSANLIRFPGPAPYRTTNKMYESSRHPTWWPTGWPESSQQQQQQPQQQQIDDAVLQQQQPPHRSQHRLPQQKQDTRFWEFGSRIPKTSTTAVSPTSPPAQWYRRFF